MCLFIWILLVRSRIKMEDADATELETPASSKPSSARKISQKHASTVTRALSTNETSLSKASMVVTSRGRPVRPVMHFWCNEHIDIDKDGTAVICSGSPNLLDFSSNTSFKVKDEISYDSRRFKDTLNTDLTRKTRKTAAVRYLVEDSDDDFVTLHSNREVKSKVVIERKRSSRKTKVNEEEQKITGRKRGRPRLVKQEHSTNEKMKETGRKKDQPRLTENSNDTTTPNQRVPPNLKNQKRKAQEENELDSLENELDSETSGGDRTTQVLPYKRAGDHEDVGVNEMGVKVHVYGDLPAEKGGKKKVCISSSRLKEDRFSSRQHRKTKQETDDDSSDSEWSETETQRLNR
jgi:hypothetical protein